MFGHHFVGSRFPKPIGDMSRFPRTGSHRLIVLRVIAKAGKRGVTDEEIEAKVVLSPDQIKKCRLELIEGGFVQNGNVMRKTTLDEDAIVWRLTPVGKQRWDESGVK